MKKLFIALVVSAMLLTFAACGEKPQPADKPTENNSDSVSDGGFAGIANPWTDVSADDITAKTGFAFAVPENAENVVYQWNENAGLAEMRFTLDGTDWTARQKKASAFEDISGMMYEWDDENCGQPAVNTLNGIEGEQHYLATEEGTVCVGLWFAQDNGLMFSLSGVAESAAEIPAQGVFVFG